MATINQFDETTRKALEATSYALLDDDALKKIDQLFKDVYQQKARTLAEFFDHSTYTIFKRRNTLDHAVDVSSNRLNALDPTYIQYLSTAQKEALRRDLMHSFYILSAQYHLDETEKRIRKLKGLSQKIAKCAELLEQIEISSSDKKEEKELRKNIELSEKHCKYLGLKLGFFVSEKMLELSSGNVSTIKDWMDAFNERRLYWVWGGGVLSLVFSMLPDDFYNKQQGEQILNAPNDVLGYVGWILYYTRLAIELGLIAKHTLPGPWMSKGEKEHISTWERFKSQVDQRKFRMLNDFAWGTVNVVTFFWLKGSGLLGYGGNLLTVGLLLVDAYNGYWQLIEESARHNEMMLRYQNDIASLQYKIKKEENEDEIVILEEQLKTLEKNRNQKIVDWTFNKAKLYTNFTYSLGLIAAFTVTIGLLLPPSALAPVMFSTLGLVGAVACFGLTFAYTAVSGTIDIVHTHKKRSANLQEYNDILKRFNDIKNDKNRQPEAKQLYLDMKILMAKSEYQKRLATYQKVELIRSLFIDAMIPPLIFVSLTFAPTGVGVGVVAAGIALIIMSKIIMMAFKPKEGKLPKFDDDAFEAFKESSSLSKDTKGEEKQSSKPRGFFTGRNHGNKKNDNNDNKDLEFQNTRPT